MDRLEHGERYYFISITYWKVCQTHDWRFPTDRQKYRSGNYFPEPEDATRLFKDIDTKFGEDYHGLREYLKREDLTKQQRKDAYAEMKELVAKINKCIRSQRI